MVTNQAAATSAGPPPDAFHALADPTRRALLDRLRTGDQPVQSLAGGFPMSRPAISKHLRILREARLVSERKRGRQRMYRLEPGPLRDVDRWLAEYRVFWETNLGNLKRYVEARRDERTDGD